MLKELATIEEDLLTLSDDKEIVAKCPQIVELTEKYQDFLGALYDSGLMG